MIPGPNSYYMTGLGVEVERHETRCPPITGNIYAQQAAYVARPSILDCRGEHDEAENEGDPLFYEGEPLVVSPDEGVWIPVRRGAASSQVGSSRTVPVPRTTAAGEAGGSQVGLRELFQFRRPPRPLRPRSCYPYEDKI